MGKVYVIQENSKFNIISARQYGELIPIFEEGKQIMLSPAPAIQKLKYILRDFNDDDFLLLIGDPSMIGLACAIAADKNRGKFKVLKYDRRTYEYYPIDIDINERNKKDD
jgi:hypothetical protein|tara:strand:+ start:993 stop:1322 length:330 start_codon:yes stop_codon:yes gene_type:complete